ncbi:MAG: plasmid pRiA4b ORF-3 family protein [Bifidobacteriaceae bacterium]|jgi:hypothetical protein|nr:plasmid pRiA4b ORF-3 family protein [Bifidobacteriaceae bacterium]
MASQPIYEFYAELTGFKPKIWRRFQVMNNITVARLGYVLQTLFEMKASHLMAVEIPHGENTYRRMRRDYPEIPSDSRVFDDRDEIWRLDFIDDDTGELQPSYRSNVKMGYITEERIKYIVKYIGDELSMEYDFGDSWWVKVTLEKVFRDENILGKDLPRVLEGENFGIIEDSGGISGLAELVRAFKRKTGWKYKELSAWLGKDEFDITEFDIDDMNFRLKKIPRIYEEIYEYDLEPTKYSIGLIERKYLKKSNAKPNAST